MTNDKQLIGVNGWLAFLVFLMCLVAPAKAIIETQLNIITNERASPQITELPLWLTYQQLIWCVIALSSAILVYGGWRLARYRRRSSVKIAMACMWLASPLIVAGDYFITLALLGADAASVTFDTYAQSSFKIFAFPIVWSLYLLASTRVKNTYPITSSSYESEPLTSEPHPQDELTFVADQEPTQPQGPTSELYDLLAKLKGLLDSGAITVEEYEREKSKILAK